MVSRLWRPPCKKVFNLPMQRARYLVFVAALVWSMPVDGQMTQLLQGCIRNSAGVPLVNAAVRPDAITGFRGEPFAGATEQHTTSLASGEWNITNLEAGLWMFSTSAPD